MVCAVQSGVSVLQCVCCSVVCAVQCGVCVCRCVAVRCVYDMVVCV